LTDTSLYILLTASIGPYYVTRLTHADYLHSATSKSLLVKMFAFALKMMAYDPRNIGTYLVRT